MKLYTVLHMRQYGRVERAAREALKRVNRWIAAGLGTRNAAGRGGGGGGGGGAEGGSRTPMRTTFLPAIAVNDSYGVDGMTVSTPLVESREMFTCGKCHSPVTLPCWYCVACPGKSPHSVPNTQCLSHRYSPTYNQPRQTTSSSAHPATPPARSNSLAPPASSTTKHTLSSAAKSPPKIASVLSTEERLIALEERLQDMEVGQRAVHDRLGDIEGLLRMLQSTLVQARTPSAKNHSTWLNV